VTGTDRLAPEVARAYVSELRELCRALGVSDVRMEEGSLRCDANVSLAPRGAAEWGTRTETKNVNSLRSVERAVRYEIERQAAVLADGGRVIQETRHWHEDTGITTAGRSKEEAQDYRYFPDPDLVPLAPARDWVDALRASLPEPPTARRKRLQAAWGLTALDMDALVNAGALDLVEATVAAGTVNDKLARSVIDGVLAGEGSPDEVVAARGLVVVSDDAALGAAVDEAIAAHPDIADKVRAGKVAAAGALVGAVMKATRGQADAARVRELILDRLGTDT